MPLELISRLPAESDSDFSGQFRVLGRAVRGWALREPARYALLFGSPVPGYHAPAEKTTTPGTRVIAALTDHCPPEIATASPAPALAGTDDFHAPHTSTLI